MDLSLKYSKTSKGAKAVLAKSRALSSSYMLVLSNIDGKTTAAALQEKLQLSEEKFLQALTQLHEEAYIQVVQDFGPSVFDLKSAIEVSEISPEEFFKLELPEDTAAKTQEQLEAEERARLYAEEQARKEALAREQEEAERKLLKVTDILAKAGHKIDIEKLADADTTPPAIVNPVSLKESKAELNHETPDTPVVAELQPSEIANSQSPIQLAPSSEPTHPPAYIEPVTEPSLDETQPADEVKSEAQKQADEQSHQLELRRQAEAEQQRAEFAAKRRAEEDARAEAEQIKRKEAEAQAERKAEEKARKEEERRVRKEAEIARKLAEQQAREEAKARARAEAERKAKSEAERRARENAEAKARARDAAEHKARAKAELQAQRVAEAQAKTEEARRTREEARVREERLAAEKAVARAEAKRQAEAKSVIRAEEWAQRRAAISLLGSSWATSFRSIGRPALIGLCMVSLGLLVLLHFVSLAMLVAPVEQAMVTAIGEPVKVRDMRASLWPQPHLVLEGVTVGQYADVNATKINVYPAILSFLGEHKKIDTLEIEGLTVNQQALSRLGQWLSTAAKNHAFTLSTVLFKDSSIKVPNVELPTFNADVQINEKGGIASAALTSDNLAVNIAPSNDAFKVNIQARGWQWPLGPAITFDDLHAEGTLRRNQLDLEKVEGSLYGGTIQGYLLVNWTNGWRSNGNFQLTKIDLAEATPAVSELANLRGRLYAQVDIDSSANNLDDLLARLNVSARFEAEHGEIGGLDLSRAAAGREQVGGVTRYEQLSGNWDRKDERYQLTQLALKAGPLDAQGQIGISPQRDVSGRLQTHLNLGARQMQARINLTGKLGHIRISK